jgi:GT2 family glycosyltransferase
LQSAWYNADRYAFEDDFTAKIGTALFVKNAICYHNNPEHLSEIFHHEIWIGESLIAKWQMKEYSKKYALWISTFLLLWILAGIWCIWQKIWRLIPIIIIGVLLLLVLLKTLQRTIKERYLSHLIYVPLVMSTRGLWYIYGILKFLIRK